MDAGAYKESFQPRCKDMVQQDLVVKLSLPPGSSVEILCRFQGRCRVYLDNVYVYPIYTCIWVHMLIRALGSLDMSELCRRGRAYLPGTGVVARLVPLLSDPGRKSRVCYFGCLKGVCKSVQVLLNGIEAPGRCGTHFETFEIKASPEDCRQARRLHRHILANSCSIVFLTAYSPKRLLGS